MVKIELIATPDLKTASLRASKLLRETIVNYKVLLLNLPEEMEETLTEFMCESISYDELIDETLENRFMPEPHGSWEYAFRPILEILPELRSRFRELEILCYGSSEDELASSNIASTLACFTLRTSLTGGVNADEWRLAIADSLKIDKKAVESEVKNLIRKAESDTVCLSDIGGRRLKPPLIDAGFHVSIQYLEKPFHHNPLMILKRKMARSALEDDEIERLVRCHVDYIRKYVYVFENRDMAYYEWVWDSVPWMRKRINRDEISFLRSIINAD